MRLFVERAKAANGHFSLSDDNAAVVAAICRQLDGLPLALELAAGRTRLFPPAALLSRLDRRLPLLVGGARDLPARHQTLSDTIAWSYDLLSPAEQALFRRLAVFTGGFTLEAAEAVALPSLGEGVSGNETAEGTAGDLLDGLSKLIDASLIIPLESATDEPRFRMLETIREFGIERLRTSPDEEMHTRSRHLAYFITLAETAELALRGAEQYGALARLEAEHANCWLALEWACSGGLNEPALALAGALGRFWEIHGHIRDGRRWLTQTLAAGGAAAASVRVKALLAAGTLARTAGDYTDARRRLVSCLALQQEAGDRSGAARTLFELAQVAHYLGDFAELDTACRASLDLYRELDDRHGIAVAAGMLGHAAWHLGAYAEAHARISESITVWTDLNDHLSVSWAQTDLGNIARDRGDLATVCRHFRGDGIDPP